MAGLSSALDTKGAGRKTGPFWWRSVNYRPLEGQSSTGIGGSLTPSIVMLTRAWKEVPPPRVAFLERAEVYAQGALRADREGGEAQARKSVAGIVGLDDFLNSLEGSLLVGSCTWHLSVAQRGPSGSPCGAGSLRHSRIELVVLLLLRLGPAQAGTSPRRRCPPKRTERRRRWPRPPAARRAGSASHARVRDRRGTGCRPRRR